MEAGDGGELVQRATGVPEAASGDHRNRQPQAATSGARRFDTLSPTPPVECLSTLRGPGFRRRSLVPERSIASVQVRSSAGSSPRKKTAMHSAAIW